MSDRRLGPVRTRAASARLGLVLWLLAPIALAGCLVEDTFPMPQPGTCGDGLCQWGFESCSTCPDDCSCCTAISSVGTEGSVTNADNGTGESDGNFVTLDETSALVLVLGREAFDVEGGGDVSIIGQVDSKPDAADSPSCPVASAGTGAFEISASLDGTAYRLIGFWTPTSTAFDIGCGELKSARYFRVQAQLGAKGRLDAIKAASCLDE